MNNVETFRINFITKIKFNREIGKSHAFQKPNTNTMIATVPKFHLIKWIQFVYYSWNNILWPSLRYIFPRFRHMNKNSSFCDQIYEKPEDLKIFGQGSWDIPWVQWILLWTVWDITYLRTYYISHTQIQNTCSYTMQGISMRCIS